MTKKPGMLAPHHVLGRAEPWVRRLSWWPWLIPPVALAALIVGGTLASRSDEWAKVIEGPGQQYMDLVAPFLVAAAVAIYAARAAITRNPLCYVLVGLSASLLCREIHFEWTHRGIYVMLAGVAIWALAWRRWIARPLRDFRHTSWVVATLWAYVVAFLLYKRVLRVLPGEGRLHNFLEEGLEIVAHLMLVAASLMGSWRRYRRAGVR